MTPRPAVHQHRWPYPEAAPEPWDRNYGSMVTTANAADLERLGLGHDRAVLVVWK